MSARLIIAVAGGVAVAAMALIGRRFERSRLRSTPLDLGGLDSGIVLFSDAACRRCDAVRSMLHARGVPFTEIGYASNPDAHRTAGVSGVPLLVVRDPSGQVTAQIAGVPTRRRLHKALVSADRRGGAEAGSVRRE